MEPIQILEAIKEDIRDKFDGDPLMMRTMNLVITEYKARSERLHKPVVMQAGSEKQPYFKLSTNEFGKHWLFYKPLKSEPGKYGCWMPIDDEFYSEFNKLQKAALGSEAAVGKAGEDASVSDGK